MQSEYSLWSRDTEDEIIPTIQELGIGLVAYSPLGRGFLSGTVTRIDDLAPDDYRRNSPRFQGENFDKNLQLVERVEEIASEKRVTPGQLALAWLLAKSNEIVPIPGTKRRTYLEDNVATTKIELTTSELQNLDAVAPKNSVMSDRYSDMSAVNG